MAPGFSAIYADELDAREHFTQMMERFDEAYEGEFSLPRPNGTDAIPIEARIVHLADVFDALTMPRVYKHAWTTADAAGVIRESGGRMFDPEVVKAFESLFARGIMDAR